MGIKARPIEERFFEKVKKTRTCWLWTASLNSNGYGQINLNPGTGKAHRVSWEIHVGKIPKGIGVLHKCNNPICVNPYHLYLGTQADNVRDMFESGRNPNLKGSRSGRSKITEKQAIYIRNSKKRVRDLAIQFKLDRSTICNIKSKKIWSHI